MSFLPGQIVITEGNRKSLPSKLVAWATGSWWTHAFVVSGVNLAVEATFPRVRQFKLSERLEQLEREDRAYVVFDMPMASSLRWKLAGWARGFVGKWYDVGQLFYYKIRGQFVKDGIGTLVCSRVGTAIYSKAGINLFPREHLREVLPPGFARVDNLEDGYVQPADYFYSVLNIVAAKSSSQIDTSRLLHQTA